VRIAPKYYIIDKGMSQIHYLMTQLARKSIGIPSTCTSGDCMRLWLGQNEKE